VARIIDKEEKRLDIARASIDLFCEKGIAQTTMDAIARSAGVAKGTIYLYFKNKEEIVFAIWDMVCILHVETFERSICPNMSAKDKILAFFNFTAFNEDSQKIMHLYQHFVSAMLVDKTGLYTAYFESFFQKDYDLIAACLHEGIASGEFKEHNVHLLTQSIVLIVKGTLIKAKASNFVFDEAQALLSEEILFLLENFTRKTV
jgi:TetR/AcrR family acrAB operon transcriptional repressor